MTSRTKKVLLPAAAVGLAGTMLATIMAIGHGKPAAADRVGPGQATPGVPGRAAQLVALPPFSLGECAAPGGKAPGTVVEGNPKARAAAQHGLGFLVGQTKGWQERNQCFGCHVHAVTLEALAVGRHHQYEVAGSDFDAVLEGVLRLPGGARTKAGLSYHGDSLFAPSKAFGGAALARYDSWVDKNLRDDLFRVAGELIGFQDKEGWIKLDWINLPVGAGPIQGTYQAIATWQQAYSRSADDRWLTAVQKGEDYLQKTVAAWGDTPGGTIQEVNYALLGLLAAGVGGNEDVMVKLKSWQLAAQNPDGSWGFERRAGMSSSSAASVGGEGNPFATGQTLYTLRMLGMADSDPVIARGTAWLIEHQRADGGWSDAGFGKAEAMWGVLGLVSLDVLTVAIEEIDDGQHVAESQMIHGRAIDNQQGGGVLKVELRIDDIVVHGACGDRLDYRWDTRGMADGKHIVEVLATNTKGQTSRRRIEVYAGAVYLTQLGSKYADGGTVVSLRNIAPRSLSNRVRLQIFTLAESAGAPQAGRELATREQAGSQGPMSFFWDGKATDGAAQPNGKYLARLTFLDTAGKPGQSEQLVFVHDTPEGERANYGEISGALALPAALGAGDAENTVVELVDEEGRVVQQATSTKQGQYRFKGVAPEKKYKVRVNKPGYKPTERDIDAEKGKDNRADDMALEQ